MDAKVPDEAYKAPIRISEGAGAAKAEVKTQIGMSTRTNFRLSDLIGSSF
jgi:hypothetical protein